MKSIGRIFIIFMVLYGVMSDCPLWPYPRQTAVGLINIELNNDPKLHNNPIEASYPLREPFQEAAVNVVLAVQSFELNGLNQVNFFIQNLPTTQTTQLKFRAQANGSPSWRLITFTFFATQSSLFQISTQAVSQFSTGAQAGKYSVYRPIVNFNSFRVQPMIQVFLNGLQLKSKPLDQQYNTMAKQFQSFRKFSSNPRLITSFQQALQVKKSLFFNITGVKFVSRLYTFAIQTNCDLKSVRFSYIIFSRQALSEKHSFIFNDFTLVNGNQYRFTGLRNMEMVLTGLMGFLIPRDTRYKNYLTFQNFEGQSFFDVQTNIKHFSLSYTSLAFQLQQKFVCQACANSPTIYDDKFCVQICPRGFTPMRRLENYYCQKCDIEQLKVVDSSSGQCVCAKRHYLQIRQNLCKPCRYDCMTCSEESRCLVCDNNLLQTKRRLSNTGRCDCPSTGFYDDRDSENIVCQKCNSGCLTCNGPKYHDCLSCTPDKELNPMGFCTCRNGFVEDSAGNCGCNPPRVFSNNFCFDPRAACNQNQTLQVSQSLRRCVCRAGFIEIKNDCIKCGNNAIFNQNQLECQCVNKTVLINGECVPCGINQIYDDVSGICICKAGSFKSNQGNCITCPLKMTYLNGKCECIYNYFERRPGVCQRCLKESDGPKCQRNWSS